MSCDHSETIMIVDDSLLSLDYLTEILTSEGYTVSTFSNGPDAIMAAGSSPPDLLLLDITMPEMDGYEVCYGFKNNFLLSDIPIIFLSSLTKTDEKVKAFEVGGVDYITKPFQVEEVKARVEIHLNLHRLQAKLERHNRKLEEIVHQQVRQITDAHMATIFALAKLAECRDKQMGQHLERVQLFCRMLAESLGKLPAYKEINKQYIDNIYNACVLHDIGKVAIEDNVLLKPGKLNAGEFERMKQHSLIGARTLEEVCRKYKLNQMLDMGIAIARWHHEKWDGSGYPDGLKGEEIPLCARIMSICDVYDALRSKRCYKEPIDHDEVINIMKELNASHFDPGVFAEFIKIAPQFSQIYAEL